MPTFEQLIDIYGSIEAMPEYLRAGIRQREAAEQRRIDEAAEVERERAAEEARVKALRRPPRNARLEGRTLRWEEPETAGELAPAGYWVSEERNGEWTKHGDYLLPHHREAVLFGEGPAYVETWYHNMALGEMYRSPVVHAGLTRAERIP